MIVFDVTRYESIGDFYNRLSMLGVKVQPDPVKLDTLLVAGSPCQPLTPDLTALIKENKPALLAHVHDPANARSVLFNKRKAMLIAALPLWGKYEHHDIISPDEIFDRKMLVILRIADDVMMSDQKFFEEICVEIAKARQKSKDIHVYGKTIPTCVPQSSLPALFEHSQETLLRRE